MRVRVELEREQILVLVLMSEQVKRFEWKSEMSERSERIRIGMGIASRRERFKQSGTAEINQRRK